VDHVTIEDFGETLTENLDKLETQLRNGEYRPQAIKRVHIPKPGTNDTRPLGIPTIRDRTVQAAVRHVLEPILERFRIPWISLPQASPLSADEELGEIQGDDSRPLAEHPP
jgi:retron-type reverse transcriptase